MYANSKFDCFANECTWFFNAFYIIKTFKIMITFIEKKENVIGSYDMFW